MSVVLQSSGGGSVTLQEPATASNRTLTLPDTTGTVATTADVNAVASLTMLGTLTLSGTSQVISSLNLTSYKQLNIVYNNMSFTASSTPTLNGINIAATFATATNGGWGQTIVDLNVGTFVTNIFVAAANTGTVTGTSSNSAGGNCGVTTATTSLTFAGGTFDAGTIYVYGVK